MTRNNKTTGAIGTSVISLSGYAGHAGDVVELAASFVNGFSPLTIAVVVFPSAVAAYQFLTKSKK